jgi:hypothetical protein
MLSRIKVFQIIKKGKRRLDIEEVRFRLKYSMETSKIGKSAEIFIWSDRLSEIVLYPTATFFSVRHELCHAKLYEMGIPLTNTEKDINLFPDQNNLLRMIVIVEWYINELQRRVFNEYYAVDKSGTPRPPPFHGLPQLPQERFTAEEINQIVEIAEGQEEIVP